MTQTLITLVGAPAAAEALKLWGPFAICLLLLGGALALMWIRLNAKDLELKARDAEIKDLRTQISELQEKRLQDAQKLMTIAQSGTATMAARTEGDALQQELLTLLVQGFMRAGLVQPTPLPTPRSQ